MSKLLKKFFGGNEGKPPSPEEAIQRLREVEEMLQKKSDFLEKKMDTELAAAKKCGTKNKREALKALKRKKRYEKQLTQLDGTLCTIELQRESLEESRTTAAVVKVMEIAGKALKAAHSNLDLDKIQNLMEEVAEQQEFASDLNDIISQPIFGEDFDEDDLLAELEDLEVEDMNPHLLEVGTADPFPNVPTAEPAEPGSTKSKAKSQEKTQEEDYMKELEMWAS